MALQSSGAISLDDIHDEAGGTSGSTCTVNDADIRGLIDASDGATTSFDDWYGAASAGDVVLNAVGTIESGGGGDYSNVILQISIATNGQDSDFGDLTVGREDIGAASSSTRGLFYSGFSTAISGARSDTIDYVTIASAGNASDFGNASAANSAGTGISNNTRAVFHQGYTGAVSNVLEYVTIANTGNTTDFGDATVSAYNRGSTSNTTRGVFAGGALLSGYSNVMDYITIANTGNASDFGDLLVVKPNTTGHYNFNSGNVSSSTYGFFTGGGYPQDQYGETPRVEYITIGSTGNGSDFGDLNREIRTGFQGGNKIKGLCGGGLRYDNYDTTGNETTNRAVGAIDVSVFTLGTSGSGSDWGDLTKGAWGSCGLSDDHGGIG